MQQFANGHARATISVASGSFVVIGFGLAGRSVAEYLDSRNIPHVVDDVIREEAFRVASTPGLRPRPSEEPRQDRGAKVHGA